MIRRQITRPLLEALNDTPVVLLTGARQTGKSTLVQWLAENKHKARYLTLDDAAVLAAATSNPQGFVEALDTPVVIDEVQRAPDLFLAIKAAVDRKRSPGGFLLTGSANVMLLPRVAESLAGRMEVLTLWPFSQSEIESRDECVIDRLFAPTFTYPRRSTETKDRLIARVLAGGFPEATRRTMSQRRSAWFGSYITTILQRDVRELAHIEGLTALPHLLSLLATRSGTLLNFSELANSTTIPQTTLKRYMALLETTYLVYLLPAWSGNLGKRLIKTPKLFLSDSGLTAHLLGANAEQLSNNPTLFGHLLESFVLSELSKHAGWSEVSPKIYHFRTHASQEVDFVLEAPDGSVVAIEVKASATVDAGTFATLQMLMESMRKKFIRGVVFYTGREAIPFAKNLLALPVKTLWE